MTHLNSIVTITAFQEIFSDKQSLKVSFYSIKYSYCTKSQTDTAFLFKSTIKLTFINMKYFQ